MPKGLLFINDLFLGNASPDRRIDDDYLGTLKKKLDYCFQLSSDKDLIPVFTGKILSKSFDLKILIEMIDMLQGTNSVFLASQSETDKEFNKIDKKSTIGILSNCNVIQAVPFGQSLFLKLNESDSLCLSNGLFAKDSDIVFYSNTARPIDLEAIECNPNVKFLSSELFTKGVKDKFSSFKNHRELPIISRRKLMHDTIKPKVTSLISSDFMEYVVPHVKHIIDTHKDTSEIEKIKLQKSDFVRLMKEEMIRLEQENNENLIENELSEVFIKFDADTDVVSQISELMSEVGI